MRYCRVLHLCLVLAFLTRTSISRATTDTLRPGWFIYPDENNLVSANGVFELGFFRAGDSLNFYVGIWYKDISPQTVVWVASRSKPFSYAGSALSLDDDGTLKVADGGDGSVVVLVHGRGQTATGAASSATLLDSGNFVVRGAVDLNQTVLWQSFDHPADTWLPGVRLLQDLVSWKSPTDPSPGDCVFGPLYEVGGSLIVRKKGTWSWRSGDLVPRNVSGDVSAPWRSYYPDAHLRRMNASNPGGGYFVYDTTRNSSLTRVVAEAEGQVKLYAWSTPDKAWKVLWAAPGRCEIPVYCGPNSLCNSSATPVCQCLPGFIPDISGGWASGDWSRGCVRRFPIGCDATGAGDGFLPLHGVALPPQGVNYTTAQEYPLRKNETVERWRERCLADCNCTAYASDCQPSRRSSTSCSVWYVQGPFTGLLANSSRGTGIYLHLAASELNQTSTLAISPGGGGGRKRQLLLALPIVSATLLFFGAGLCCFVRRKRPAHEKDNGEELLLRDMGMDGAVTYKFVDVNRGGGTERGPEICLYSFSNVLAATDNFSDHNKLGEGGFGPVFKGKLSDGQEIAIKRLSTRSRQGLEEFKTEILLIARLQHKNLVRLLGCCIQGEEKLLIYEYMSNKSLDFFLFNSQRAAQLDWGRRIKIIEGIAQGLLYLHKYSRLTIIHRDLKASNILLDNEMNPKISDFGMARIFSSNECQANTNRIVGTYGYMSPEYAMQGLFSIKSDIFSFGVLLLELVSGKKNIGSHRYFPIPRSLLGYAWELWNVGKELELTDPSLSDSCPGLEVSRCIYIGLMCVQESANDRPTMTEVVSMLSSESLTRRELKPPAFLSGMQTTQKSFATPNSINDVTVSALEGR